MTRWNGARADGHVAYDPDSDTYEGRFAWDDADEPSASVIRTVASATDSDPETMCPLYRAVDPDALNDLFADGTDARRRDGQVVFRYEGCSVRVNADGRVVVAPP